MTSDVKAAALVLLGALALLGRPSTAEPHAGNHDPALLHVCIGNVSKVVRSVGVSGSCIVWNSQARNCVTNSASPPPKTMPLI